MVSLLFPEAHDSSTCCAYEFREDVWEKQEEACVSKKFLTGYRCGLLHRGLWCSFGPLSAVSECIAGLFYACVGANCCICGGTVCVCGALESAVCCHSKGCKVAGWGGLAVLYGCGCCRVAARAEALALQELLLCPVMTILPEGPAACGVYDCLKKQEERLDELKHVLDHMPFISEKEEETSPQSQNANV